MLSKGYEEIRAVHTLISKENIFLNMRGDKKSGAIP